MMEPAFIEKFIEEHKDGQPFGMTHDFRHQIEDELGEWLLEEAETNLYKLVPKKKAEPEKKD